LLVFVFIRWSRWRRGKLAGGFDERSLLDGRFHDVLGQLAALAALGGDTQLFADFLERPGAAIHKFLDLAIGDSFAKTDVHGSINSVRRPDE
jgi:hypothetical protein